MGGCKKAKSPLVSCECADGTTWEKPDPPAGPCPDGSSMVVKRSCEEDPDNDNREICDCDPSTCEEGAETCQFVKPSGGKRGKGKGKGKGKDKGKDKDKDKGKGKGNGKDKGKGKGKGK